MKKKSHKRISNDYLLQTIGASQGIDRLLAEKISIGSRFWYAIPPRFSEMKFGDFILIDMLFEKAEITLAANRDAHNAMARVCAVIYRRRPLEELSAQVAESRFEIWRGVDRATVGSVYQNYRAMRFSLTKKYPHLFPVAVDNESTEAKPSQKPQKITPSDWLAWRDKLAIEFHTTPDGANGLLLSDALRYINRQLQ